LAPNREHLPFFTSCPSDKVSRRAEERRKARIRAYLEDKRAKWWPVSVSSLRGK
jgi:hypothetical protein